MRLRVRRWRFFWLTLLGGLTGLGGLAGVACEDSGSSDPTTGNSTTGGHAETTAGTQGQPRPGSSETGPAVAPFIYDEQWRPQVHYSPPYGWMNDPNGLVYAQGLWHLFYQNNPLGNEFGFISWGHAFSDDLVRWKPVGVAIPFGERERIFSGSAVLDSNNTSGLCEPEAAETGNCVIAIYTADVDADLGTIQNQNLAVSNDGGIDFDLFDGNPVLDVGSQNFRDPKVFWHEPSMQWIQVVARPIERQVAVYGSPNLREWQWLSDFGPAGAVDGIWECPDLFELPVPDSEETRWVMKVDHNPGHVAGGSGGQYFLGEFDGVQFVPTEPPPEVELPRWLDWGSDFYCATTWFGAPDGQKRWLGWMDNWEYASDLPTYPWRGQMSVPRRLELVRRNDALFLGQRIAPEIERLRGTAIAADSAAAFNDAIPQLSDAAGWDMELEVEVPPSGSTQVMLTQTDAEPYGIIGIRSDRVLTLERPDATNAEVNDTFGRSLEVPLPDPTPDQERAVRLRILIDQSSVEVLTADGTIALTVVLLPVGEPTGPRIMADPDAVVSATVWPLGSIWHGGTAPP